jgi:hypothetical protein
VGILVLAPAAWSATPLPPDIIQDALQVGLCDFSPAANPPGGRPPNVHRSKAMFLLAVAAWQDGAADPDHVRTGARLLDHVRAVITPGREPNADGTFEGWSHGTVALSLALVRRNPVLWPQLSPDEQTRVDLLLEAFAISGHYCFDDQNDARSSISGRWSTFDKTWHNNLGEGTFSGVIAGVVAFGASELDELYRHFNYDTFMARLEQAGFTQIAAHWTQGEHRLRPALGRSFTYHGLGLEDLGRMVALRTRQTHPHRVSDREGGVAGLMAGGSSPVRGEWGMVQELNHTDGSGPRSDLLYAYETWMNALPNALTVKLTGHWGQDEWAAEADRRLRVGGLDLIYKMTQGYESFSNGATRVIRHDTNSANPRDTPDSKGYLYLRALFEAFILEAPPPIRAHAD